MRAERVEMNDRNAGGGCCSLILFLLAIYGAVQLYQFVTRPDTCDGADGWIQSSNERYQEIDNVRKLLNPRSSTSADLLQFAEMLRDGAKVQVNSKPPSAGVELNLAYAGYYSMMADSFEAIALGAEPPYSNTELLQEGRDLTRLMTGFEEKC